ASEKEGSQDLGPRITAGVLRVVPEKVPPLKLESVKPTIVYPDDPDKREDKHPLVFTGEGLGGRVRDYALLVDGAEVRLCESTDNECGEHAAGTEDACCKGPRARFVSDHQLEIDGPFTGPDGRALEGEHLLSLRAGDMTSKPPFKVAFTPHTVAKIRNIALGSTFAILLAMIGLVATGARKHYVGSKVLIGRAFLIDAESDTYSLSKFQFYLWSVAALLAYTYLTLSRCLVQGKLDIADIPKNLPMILGVSASTAVLSIGIGKVRGPKAAGVLHPSFADLLSTGGVVSPERFQLLLWTIVAVASFVLSVLKVDPMVLNDLPAVPDGLLALSGVSSAAYLGGKYARGPGPVIDDVLVKAREDEFPGFEVTVVGSYLSLDASFEVDGQPISDLLDPEQNLHGRPRPGKRQEGDTSKFAKALTLFFTKLPPQWLELLNEPDNTDPVPTITIANSDGQRADGEVRRKVLLDAGALPNLPPAPPPAAAQTPRPDAPPASAKDQPTAPPRVQT
ncbi:MAG TPA: hypothetical protein VNN72_14200, partial [Polyangiaceae bacterium]|nr:hypothetical protein [Polyangiaceae bacterium]